jgi:hypothetical protein
MASEGPKYEGKSIASRRKYVTLMIPQKLEIISKFESGDSQECGYIYIEHWMINYQCCLEMDKL